MALGQILSGNNGPTIPRPETPHKPNGAPAGYEYVWDDREGKWILQPLATQTTAPGPGPGPNKNEPEPDATTTPPAPSGSMSSGDYEGSAFLWPEFHAPRFQAPAPFTYDAFKAPSLEDAKNEPGYEFARREGQRALENSAAGKGVLRTGGTLKDLIGWGNQFAEQNYGNVYNRSSQTYTTNRNNAADNYDRNYGVSRDVYDRDYRAAYDEFQPKFRSAELTFDDLYRRWKAELDATTTLAGYGAGGN